MKIVNNLFFNRKTVLLSNCTDSNCFVEWEKCVYFSPIKKTSSFPALLSPSDTRNCKGKEHSVDSQGLWDSQVWELVEDWRTPFRMVFTMLRCLKLTSLDTFQTFLEMVIFGELGTVFLPCFAAQTIKKVIVEKQNYSKDRFCFLILCFFSINVFERLPAMWQQLLQKAAEMESLFALTPCFFGMKKNLMKWNVSERRCNKSRGAENGRRELKKGGTYQNKIHTHDAFNSSPTKTNSSREKR